MSRDEIEERRRLARFWRSLLASYPDDEEALRRMLAEMGERCPTPFDPRERYAGDP